MLLVLLVQVVPLEEEVLLVQEVPLEEEVLLEKEVLLEEEVLLALRACSSWWRARCRGT